MASSYPEALHISDRALFWCEILINLHHIALKSGILVNAKNISLAEAKDPLEDLNDGYNLPIS
jgi:hypothetical protein